MNQSFDTTNAITYDDLNKEITNILIPSVTEQLNLVCKKIRVYNIDSLLSLGLLINETLSFKFEMIKDFVLSSRSDNDCVIYILNNYYVGF